MRKSYTSNFKAKVALESVRGDRKLSDLASHYEVHPSQIRQWRKVLLEGLPEIFSDARRKKAVIAEQDQSRLYEEIGRLKMELNWLKKKSEQIGE